MGGKTGNALHRLRVPFPLEFQVVDRDDRFNPPEEIPVMETLLQVNGNESGLPVMAVDQIRLETDHRKSGQKCLGEESKFLNLPDRVVAVRLKAAKVAFIINEIVMDAVGLRLKNADIDILPVEIHIEMRHIPKLILHLLLHAFIFRNDHTHIIIFLINALGQRSHNVCKTTRLDKRNTF